MNTIINVKCVDHTLTLTNTPILSSGSQNVDLIEFEFCPLWKGFVKEAIFWKANDPKTLYRMLFDADSNSVKIPPQVIDESGKFIFAVRGVLGDDIRTSNIVEYSVVDGILGEGADPEFNQSVYEEILAELQNIRLTCGEQIKEQNNGLALGFWVGTQEEYDALETPPVDTFCIITDEPGANELLENLNAANAELINAKAEIEKAHSDADFTRRWLHCFKENLADPFTYSVASIIPNDYDEVVVPKQLEYDTWQIEFNDLYGTYRGRFQVRSGWLTIVSDEIPDYIDIEINGNADGSKWRLTINNLSDSVVLCDVSPYEI